jgi:outer membrane protein OmpA-like peptidoglycan-associated protein
VSYARGQDAHIKGLIVSRDGDDMVINDEDGHIDLVTITADTRITSPSGIFKTAKKTRDVTNLLPGLIVDVNGSGGTRGNLIAGQISFRSSALRVAEQIAAGDVMMDRRVDQLDGKVDATQDSLEAANKRMLDSLETINQRTRDSLAAVSARFDDLDKYDAKDSVTVTFATNSSELSDEAKSALSGIASRGAAMNGYLVEVTGFADATGRVGHNQGLSDRRADAVVNYLSHEGTIPLRRILNPTGFGESRAVATNDTAEGRAQNRRVEVRILVNRANKR